MKCWGKYVQFTEIVKIYIKGKNTQILQMLRNLINHGIKITTQTAKGTFRTCRAGVILRDLLRSKTKKNQNPLPTSPLLFHHHHITLLSNHSLMCVLQITVVTILPP